MNDHFESHDTMTPESLIRLCADQISSSDGAAGAGRQLRHPMLTIFWGQDVHINRKIIYDTFRACWAGNTQKIGSLDNTYTSSQLEDSIVDCIQREGFLDGNRMDMIISWFWDLMDNNFDAYFNCLRQNYKPPHGTAVHPILFAFFSQKNGETSALSQKRLLELIPWAQKNRIVLVLISDVSVSGLLLPSGIQESYRMAASVLLLLNSLDNGSRGNLLFHMESLYNQENCKSHIWSAGYHSQSKNLTDIVCVTLEKMLCQYQDSNKHAGIPVNSNAKERLCGTNKSYPDFLDEIVQKCIFNHCPSRQDLWEDIPYTSATCDFEDSGSTTSQSKGGLFSRLFQRTPQQPLVELEDVINSLGDFWDACLQMYYLNPVTQWINSDRGQQEIKGYVFSRINAAFSNNDIPQLKQECIAIHSLLNMAPPAMEEDPTDAVPILLHHRALLMVKQIIWKSLVTWLEESIAEFCQNSNKFEPMLESLLQSLKQMNIEHSIRQAYGQLADRVLSAHPEILTQYIHPCKDESELLAQLAVSFEHLVDLPGAEIYRGSLKSDLDFRVNYGGGNAAQDAISDCFHYDMTRAIRLRLLATPDNPLCYCILNSAMHNIVTNHYTVSDNCFIVSRSDRIERLMLLHTDLEQFIDLQ